MSEWHRHTWNKGMLRATDFSAADKLALCFCAVYSTYGTDDTFSVRQSTIAANTGLSERSVRHAFKLARELGWLDLVTERQRGSRGKSDQYRLVIPDTVSPTSEEVPAEYAATPIGLPAENAPKYRQNMSKVPEETEAPTSGNDAPLGYVLRFLEEGAPPPPPAPNLDHLGQPRCRKHRGWQDPPDCRPCGVQRQLKEDLDKYAVQRRAALLTATWAAVHACDECDPNGLVGDADSAHRCPLHPHPSQIEDVA